MIDIMGKIGFGREMRCQSEKQYDFLPGVVASTGKWNSVNVQSTSLAKFRLGEVLYPQQVLFKYQSWQQVKDYIQDRLGEGDSRATSMFADMIDMQGQEHGENLPINELWVDATVLISGCKSYCVIKTLDHTKLTEKQCPTRSPPSYQVFFSTSVEIQMLSYVSQMRFDRPSLTQMRFTPAPRWTLARI